MPELAYLNGEFLPIEDATISIEDRGFQFGDGLYEVVVTYDGQPFQLDAHLKRLQTGLAFIELSYDFDACPLEPIIEEGLKRSGFSSAMVYMQITRGVAPRAHYLAETITPTVVMTFKPKPVLSSELRRRGARAMTTPDMRWSNCYVKAITLLPNIMAKNAAVQQGYDDAIFVTDRGEVREFTAANLFVVSGDRILYPPRDESILHGVTQGFLMECARDAGLEMASQRITLDELHEADELILSSTTAEVLGVTSVDGQPIADGQVGPITTRLYDAFCERDKCPLALQ